MSWRAVLTQGAANDALAGPDRSSAKPEWFYCCDHEMGTLSVSWRAAPMGAWPRMPLLGPTCWWLDDYLLSH